MTTADPSAVATVRSRVSDAEWESSSILILRNHGLLTAAETIADAFVFMYVFEAACTMQVRAQAGGSELIAVDPRIVAGAGRP